MRPRIGMMKGFALGKKASRHLGFGGLEGFRATCYKALGLLGGSWVVISGVISPLIWVIAIVILLIILLITTHEPPSMVS